MIVQTNQLRWTVTFLLIALAVIGTEWLITHLLAFGRTPDLLALGITADLTLGLPVLYYFMVVKRARINRGTLLAVMLLSGMIAYAVLPIQHHRYLGYWEKMLVLIEAGIVGLVLIKGRTVLRRFRSLQARTPDFVGHLAASLAVVIDNGRLADVLAAEICVFRYGLFGWTAGVEKVDHQRSFTTYQESGQVAFVSTLVVVGLIETVLVHLLVARWSSTVAAVATTAGLYGLLFFIADTVATTKRPVLLDGDTLQLRFGLRWRVTCPIAGISRISVLTDKPVKDRDTLNVSFLVSPTVLITFDAPVTVEGIYGIRRSVRRIACCIDQRDELTRAISDHQSTTR